ELADVTWPGERGDLPLCRTCILGILPRIMAEAALAGVKRHKCWQEARECYQELRSTYWMYVCDELDDVPEGLVDEDDVPEKVIERENREWDRRQDSLARRPHTNTVPILN